MRGCATSMDIRCRFCGQQTDEKTKEHVVSKCLYAPALLDPKVQRLTVPACKTCNNSWSQDETLFRNLIVSTTETPVTKTLFQKVIRSMEAQPYEERKMGQGSNPFPVDGNTGRTPLQRAN